MMLEVEKKFSTETQDAASQTLEIGYPDATNDDNKRT
jgi:hypothetical protein